MDFSILSYGAVGDGCTLDSKAIQTAIDTVSNRGGGTLYFPPGRYLTGTLHLRSGVFLHLDAGATLLGSRSAEDYTKSSSEFTDAVGCTRSHALILAEGESRIGIVGRGTIDGQGGHWKTIRPMLLRFIQCEGITLDGITLRDSGGWVQHYLQCRDLQIRAVRVDSMVNNNNDGINLDGCENVVVSDCHFSSLDDAFTLKCTTPAPCRNIVVSNCLFRSDCNGIKFGTESVGGFEHVTISNCVVYDTRLCGLTLASVDGAFLRNVLIQNIAMNRVGAALFIRRGQRSYQLPKEITERPIGEVKNIVIRNITATEVDPIGSAVMGLPDSPIENLTLESIHISGNGSALPPAQDPEELPANYPQYDHWGTFPAKGIYFRHVHGLTLRNSTIDIPHDPRPAFTYSHVKEAV